MANTYRSPEALALLPEHMREGIVLHIEHGLPHCGDFLRSLLENDFMRAATFADQENIAALGNWARYLYSYAPAACYGSKAKVDAWIGRGGLIGIRAAAASPAADDSEKGSCA